MSSEQEASPRLLESFEFGEERTTRLSSLSKGSQCCLAVFWHRM